MVYIKSNPFQTQLLPTNLRDIIADGHICYLIEELVHSLDYSDFDDEVSGAGAPSYHPRIKIKVLIYGVIEGVTSSRKLEKLTYENVVFRYLSEGTNPDFHTLAMFRKNNGNLIQSCFLQTVSLAKEMDMININRLYLDGTKIMANASKKKNYSTEELDFLTSYVKEYLEKMDRVDSEEDKKFGDTNGEIIIPEHLRNKRKLKDAIRTFLKKPDKSLDDLKSAQSRNEDRINLTDPDSKLMKLKSGRTFKQAYNCQILVEDKNEMILSTQTFSSPTDVGLAIPTLQNYSISTGFSTENVEISMDNGYMSLGNIRFFNENNISAYIPTQSQAQILKGKDIPEFHVDNFEVDFDLDEVICPRGQRMYLKKKRLVKRKDLNIPMNVYAGRNCAKCKSKQSCIKGRNENKEVEISPEIRIFASKFFEKEVREVYKKRFHKGEVAQAHILHNLKYREFKSRSLKSVQVELDLVAIAHNIEKIRRIRGLIRAPFQIPSLAA